MAVDSTMENEGNTMQEKMSVDKPEFKPTIQTNASQQPAKQNDATSQPQLATGLETLAASVNSNAFIPTSSAGASGSASLSQPSKFEQENIHGALMNASCTDFVPTGGNSVNPLQSLSGGANSFQPGFGGNSSLDQDLGMGINNNSAES